MKPEFSETTAPGCPVAAHGKRHPAIGAMKGMSMVVPGVDLTEPADPEWVERFHDEKATAGDLVGGLDDPDLAR